MYIRKKSQKQEKRTAKEFSGRTQIASGSIETMKADVRTGYDNREKGKFNDSDFLIENKFTDSPHYILKADIWRKIDSEAFNDNLRVPLMQIDVRESSYVVHSFPENIGSKVTENKINSKSVRIKEEMVGTNETMILNFIKENLVLRLVDKDFFLDNMESFFD